MSGKAKEILKAAIGPCGLNPHRLKEAVLFPPKMALLPFVGNGASPPSGEGAVCPACGGGRLRRPAWPRSAVARVADLTELVRIRARRFDFWECADCGLIFRPLPQAPSWEEGNAAYYSEDYWPKAYADPRYLEAKHREKTEVFRRVYDSALKGWLEGAGARRVLEIGCFAGSWISFLKERGYEVEGVEPSRAAAEYGRRELGVRVHNGFYEEDLFEEGRFDAILCFHVLEHVREPLALLGAIHGHLRPGGVLALELPDLGPAGRRIAPERLAICVADEQWWLSCARGIHEHNLIFRKEVIIPLLGKARFKVLEESTDPRTTSKEHTVLLLAQRP